MFNLTRCESLQVAFDGTLYINFFQVSCKWSNSLKFVIGVSGAFLFLKCFSHDSIHWASDDVSRNLSSRELVSLSITLFKKGLMTWNLPLIYFKNTFKISERSWWSPQIRFFLAIITPARVKVNWNKLKFALHAVSTKTTLESDYKEFIYKECMYNNICYR